MGALTFRQDMRKECQIYSGRMKVGQYSRLTGTREFQLAFSATASGRVNLTFHDTLAEVKEHAEKLFSEWCEHAGLRPVGEGA